MKINWDFEEAVALVNTLPKEVLMNKLKFRLYQRFLLREQTY